MGLFTNIIRSIQFGQARQQVQWATQIAQQSQAAVWMRVADRSLGMGASEVIGYIKARAASVIYSQTDLVLAKCAVGAPQRHVVVDLATRQVVRLVVRQWVQNRTVRTSEISHRHAA